MLSSVLGLAVPLTGCAVTTPLDGAAAPAPTAAPSALDFTGATLTGELFDGAALAGQPVVMWFWAPWCTVCRAEAPDVASVATEYEGRVTFLGVGGRGPVEDMKAFVEETGIGGFGHLADEPGSVWTRFGIIVQPSFVIVAPDGSAEVLAGTLTTDDLRGRVDRLLTG